MPDRDELLATAADLRSEAASVRTDINFLRQYGERNRQMIRMVIVSLCVDIILTIGLAINSVRITKAFQRNDQNQAALVASCASSNTLRHAEVDLWNFILALPPAPGSNRQTPQILASFRQTLARDFAPQDCSALK